MLVSSRDVAGSSRRCAAPASERWAWGVLVYAPYGTPIDLPSLDPIWAEAQELDLSAVLHTFTVMPPYAPGGLDTWDNLWLQRSAAHPWCGMRNMAALIGSGLLDRFPRCAWAAWRPATAGCRSGWRGSTSTWRRSARRCRRT